MSREIQITLEKYFHHRTFRQNQEEIVKDIVEGKDVLAVMATGGGKSLCYQLPALMLPGMTVVISPLISLMKDQVDTLLAEGIRVEMLNSLQTFDEQRRIEREVTRGNIRILYVSPERAVTPHFIQILTKAHPSLFAVDEAHCISMWGHQFRPEYREIKNLREKFPKVPIIALTATATERVREDIIDELNLVNPNRYIGSFDRKNLKYAVFEESSANVRIRKIVSYVAAHPNDSGIIYCFSRKNTEEVAAALQKNRIIAKAYHAGLPTPERNRIQEGFLNGSFRVICATVAFGMGIDKPDVRFVIHAHLPKDIESYYQETGRAGRDGKAAECVLFYSQADRVKISSMLEGEFTSSDKLRIAKKRLGEMFAYCTAESCRRVILLSYFGEKISPCKNCDVCFSKNFEKKISAMPTVLKETVPDTGRVSQCDSESIMPTDLKEIVLVAAKGLDGKISTSSFVSYLLGSLCASEISDELNSNEYFGLAKNFSRKEVMNMVQDLISEGRLCLEGTQVMKVCVTSLV